MIHADASSARLWVDEIHTELHKEQPSPAVQGNRLQRLTTLLKSTGALPSAPGYGSIGLPLTGRSPPATAPTPRRRDARAEGAGSSASTIPA
jgi:hypothetical protein